MRIEQEERLIIEVALNWEDWRRLDKGNIIGDRYDGYNKLLIHRIYPLDFFGHGSRLKSQQQQYAKFNRETMDIDIYIPHGVLRDVRISTSTFSEQKGNLTISPNSDYCNNMSIEISYPGSLKVIDIPTYFEFPVEIN